MEIGLELQQLKSDFLVIILTSASGSKLSLAYVYRLLKAAQVLLRQVQHRAGKLGIDEELSHGKRKRAFIVQYL